jgi:predicted RNA-binding protein with PIN domain
LRWLIDGYNLMHANGLMSQSVGLTPEQFRKLRVRFLDRLVDGLGMVDAHQCTVVFDATKPPPDRVPRDRHKGLTVIYATSVPSADDAIEDLIDRHPSPRTLTVVSTDHRIRSAAAHRKARALTSDQFLDELDRMRAARRAQAKPRERDDAPRPPSREEEARRDGLTEGESAYWMQVFGELESDPETSEALRGLDPGMIPTEDELAALEREVEAELNRRFGPRS